MIIRPDRRSVELGDYTRGWGDEQLNPLEIRAFVMGNVIEVFLNDRFGFVSRVYEPEGGYLSFSCEGSEGDVLSVTIKTPEA